MVWNTFIALSVIFSSQTLHIMMLDIVITWTPLTLLTGVHTSWHWHQVIPWDTGHCTGTVSAHCQHWYIICSYHSLQSFDRFYQLFVSHVYVFCEVFWVESPGLESYPGVLILNTPFALSFILSSMFQLYVGIVPTNR